MSIVLAPSDFSLQNEVRIMWRAWIKKEVPDNDAGITDISLMYDPVFYGGLWNGR